MIYGHVVGINALGEVYVSPLADTFDQIASHVWPETPSLDELGVMVAAQLDKNALRGEPEFMEPLLAVASLLLRQSEYGTVLVQPSHGLVDSVGSCLAHPSSRVVAKALAARKYQADLPPLVVNTAKELENHHDAQVRQCAAAIGEARGTDPVTLNEPAATDSFRKTQLAQQTKPSMICPQVSAAHLARCQHQDFGEVKTLQNSTENTTEQWHGPGIVFAWPEPEKMNYSWNFLRRGSEKVTHERKRIGLDEDTAMRPLQGMLQDAAHPPRGRRMDISVDKE